MAPSIGLRCEAKTEAAIPPRQVPVRPSPDGEMFRLFGLCESLCLLLLKDDVTRTRPVLDEVHNLGHLVHIEYAGFC